MANPLAVTLQVLDIQSAAGQSAAVDIGELRSALYATLVVTASVAGAAAFTVKIETSPDGTTGWRELGPFEMQGSGAQRSKRAFDGAARYVRAAWTVGTSATFSVSAEAHVLFAHREDLFSELPSHALEDVPVYIFADALIKASCDAENEIATANPAPLTAWPPCIAQWSASIAAFRVLKYRGFNPDNEADRLVKGAHDEAKGELRRIARGELRPPGLVPAHDLGVRVSSGNPADQEVRRPLMSDDWGDFG